MFTLQTLPTSGDPFGDGIGKVAGSSLHAGVAARADERKARTAVPVHQPPGGIREAAVVNTRRQRALPAQDAVPGRHHARHFEPLDFIARLAALVPKPRVNLTRFHGVFAPTVGTGRWSRRQNGAGATRSGWLMNRQHQHNGERR